MLGPPDIEERIGLTQGNIFQGEVTPDQMWEHRLTPRTPIDGFYFCGAADSPGWQRDRPQRPQRRDGGAGRRAGGGARRIAVVAPPQRPDRFAFVVEGQATRIHVCGRLIVELQGRRLEDTLRGRQGRLLLAYLAINRDRPVRRDELAEALWSGKGAPPAYESLLAPPLSRLRKALGPGVLEGRSELQLILPPDAWIDWEMAPRLVRRAREHEDFEAAREAVDICERGLLPGLEAPWIDTRRGELADLRVEALETLAVIGTKLGRLPEAEQAARAAVQSQPFRESARAALMEVLRARGNTNEALRVYEDIRVLLREELGSSPGPALLALHAQLLREEPAAPARRRRRPRPPRPRPPRRWSSATARSRFWTRCSRRPRRGREGRS